MSPYPYAGASFPGKLAVLILCLAFALWIAETRQAHAEPAQPEAPGSIAGVVTDVQGTPLSGIEVIVYNSSGSTARKTITDQSGAYRAAVLPAGTYRILFDDPNDVFAQQYYPGVPLLAAATGLVVLGKDIDGIHATLAPPATIAGLFTISGTAPATGYIQFYAAAGDDWLSVAGTSSDNTGAYRSPKLLPGVYRVCGTGFTSSSSFGYVSCYDRISGGPRQASDVIAQAGQETAAIDLKGGEETDLSSLAGTITDADGVAVASIKATATRIDSGGYIQSIGETDTQGRYHVDKLQPGDYAVSFEDTNGFYLPGYYDDRTGLPYATAVRLAASETRTDIDGRLTLGGRISGTVTLLGQAPAPPAANYVYVMPADVPPDPYPPIVFPPFPYPPGAVPVIPAPAIPVPAIPAATNSAAPGQDTTVQASLSRTAPVNATDGTYTVPSLLPGRYKVAVCNNSDIYYFCYDFLYYGGADFASAAVISVTAGATVPDIHFVLGTGAFDGVLSGTVTYGGAPVAGIRAELRYGYAYDPFYSTLIAYTTTDAGGSYRFEGMTTGDYHVRFSDPALMLATRATSPVLVESGAEPVIVDAELVLAGRVSGQVRGADGLGAAGSDVSLYHADLGLVERTLADDQGRYSFQGLLPGDYGICAAMAFRQACYGENPFPPGDYVGWFTSFLVKVAAGAEATGIDISFGLPKYVFLPRIEHLGE